MATYYIDFDAGDDTRAGTAEATSWKTIPGTRNAGNTAYQSTAWGEAGSIVFGTGGTKVPKGTIFRLKPGTTHDSTDGGYILISSDYYDTDATIANPISFVAFQTWAGASGTITVDGTGITSPGGGFGLIHITVGGVAINGSVTDGITIRDSAQQGIAHYKTGSPQAGVTLAYLKLLNNGTTFADDATGKGSGTIAILQSTGGSIDHCEIDGNSCWINGIKLGEDNYRVTGFTVSNCIVHGLSGTNDCGIGIKAFNGQLTVSDCTTYSNYKGMDLGHQGDATSESWDITYKVLNCIAYSNSYGINFNGPRASHSGAINWYLVNSIVRDNITIGTNAYSGPFNLHIVHNVFDNNGTGNAANRNYANLCVNPDGATDTLPCRLYLRNNIFYKPAGGTNYLNKYWYAATADFVIDSDYNSFIQRASEYMAAWGYYVAEAKDFSYGADGPGHGAGSDWFDLKGDDDVAASTGHEGCDEHSVGTGATVTTVPPFAGELIHDYTLTGAYVGVDISGETWYTAEMGTDAAGVARTTWDMGAYEYVAGGAGAWRVYYAANGALTGTVPTDATDYPTGNSVTVCGNTGTLAKESYYAWMNWNTAEDGSGINYYTGDALVIGSADVVLYAVWRSKCAIIV